MRLSLVVIYVFSAMLLFGQNNKNVHELPIPKTLEQSLSTLDKTLSIQELDAIKTSPEDSLIDHEEFRYGTDFFHAWKLYDGSRLTKYFNRKGLVGSNEIYETILVSYQRYLSEKPIDFDGQMLKYQTKQKLEYEAYLLRQKADSLNGFYIPKNIDECITEFDKVFNEKSKKSFKAQEEQKAVSAAYGFGTGMWIRNNWGLWGGSRLQKYFIDLGVSDPEAMSWVILTSYHRSINDKPIDFNEQLKIRKNKKH